MPDNSTVAHANQQIPTYCVTVVTVNKGPLLSGAPMNRPSLHMYTRPRAIYSGSQIKLVATAIQQLGSGQAPNRHSEADAPVHGTYISQRMSLAWLSLASGHSCIGHPTPSSPTRTERSRPRLSWPGQRSARYVVFCPIGQCSGKAGQQGRGSCPIGHWLIRADLQGQIAIWPSNTTGDAFVFVLSDKQPGLQITGVRSNVR